MNLDDQIGALVRRCGACNGSGDGIYYGKDWTGPTEKACEECSGTGENAFSRAQVLAAVDAIRSSERAKTIAWAVAELREQQRMHLSEAKLAGKRNRAEAQSDCLARAYAVGAAADLLESKGRGDE